MAPTGGGERDSVPAAALVAWSCLSVPRYVECFYHERESNLTKRSLCLDGDDRVMFLFHSFCCRGESR